VKILSIDTSGKQAGAAIMDEYITIGEIIINAQSGPKTWHHSEILMPGIERLFALCGMELSDMDYVAYTSGPGSFTGIRIGIATAKGLSGPNNIPVIPITSLEALAHNVKNSEDHICSIIDAKNGQVYCGIFDKNYNLCANYIADDIENVLKEVDRYEKVIFTQHGCKIPNVHDTNIQASNIGMAAYRKYLQGIRYLPEEIIPEYLRPSAAERLKESNL